MTQNFLPTPEQPGRVLVVDDNANDLAILVDRLKGEPFQLTTVVNGQEALRLASAECFEAILSDVSMPGMDGLAFCRQLRTTRNARTPLMFLSDHTVEEEWIAMGLDAGALDYLMKSCALTELVAKLRVMVRLSRQQAALSASERQQTLLEIAGGAAHELSQPLASARLLLDRLGRNQREHPTQEQMSQLRDFLDRTASILNQIRGLQAYVTKPYPAGRPILDLEKSREISGAHIAHKAAKREGE